MHWMHCVHPLTLWMRCSPSFEARWAFAVFQSDDRCFFGRADGLLPMFYSWEWLHFSNFFLWYQMDLCSFSLHFILLYIERDYFPFHYLLHGFSNDIQDISPMMKCGEVANNNDNHFHNLCTVKYRTSNCDKGYCSYLQSDVVIHWKWVDNAAD